MDNKIVETSAFYLDKIDKQNFLQSVINIALNIGIMSKFDAENIQLQILSLLSEVLKKYTSQESSSVKIETAQDVLCSMIYCIDFYLLKQNKIEKVIGTIKDICVSDIYSKGLALVKKDVLVGKNLLKKVKNNRISVDIIAYNDTIDNGIDCFFNNYEINFGAHDTCASIDYPLACDNTNERGISYIIQYLNKLYFENEFCRRFTKKDILRLLNQYGDLYNFDYKDMLINVFNLILYNSCFSVINKKSARELEISISDCSAFQNKINSGVKIDFETLKIKLYTELDIIDNKMKNYINNCIKNTFDNIILYSKEEKLAYLLTIKKQSKTCERVSFQDGIQMSNEQFQALTDHLCEISGGDKKAQIIMNKISSVDDLIDLLGAYCIFEDELIDVFKKFDNFILALIIKRVYPDLFLCGFNAFSLNDLHTSEHEKQWQSIFHVYLKSLETKRIDKILKLALNIDN